MTISQYHRKYANYSEEEIGKRADVKEMELKQIFERVELKTDSDIVILAVMGSGDKRFVKHHKRIFEKFLGKPVEVNTFDITTDHLDGEKNITKHDCTMPLPDSPYDITYAHVLLKFIEIEKQFDLIINSYDVLKVGGLAIHVFDKSDYETDKTTQEDGYFSVPLEKWKNKLKEKEISFI